MANIWRQVYVNNIYSDEHTSAIDITTDQLAVSQKQSINYGHNNYGLKTWGENTDYLKNMGKFNFLVGFSD